MPLPQPFKRAAVVAAGCEPAALGPLADRFLKFCAVALEVWSGMDYFNGREPEFYRLPDVS
jgi:hypothetical protein